MKVWRKYGEIQWRWQASHRHQGEERVTVFGRALTRRMAERAARRALRELVNR